MLKALYEMSLIFSRSYRLIALALVLSCLKASTLMGQDLKKTDPDVVLQEGLDLYKEQRYLESLALADRGLQLAPDYHDIRILRIRNLQNLDSLAKALEDLRYLWDKAPNYYDVRDLSVRQIRLMGDTVDMAMIDFLIEKYSHPIEISIVKAQFLFKRGMFRSSRDLALTLIDEKITGSQRYQLNLLLRATVRNEVGVNYQYFDFDDAYNRENWQNFIVEYQHNFNATTAIARVTHSDRGIDSGELYELDIYPVLSERLYLFGSLGGSTGSFFPDVKANASVFYGFMEGFEAEIGARLLRVNGSNFFTGVGGITSYLGKFYLNVRAAVGPRRMNRLIQNYQFNARYYFGGADSYVFTRLGRGISPDESPLFVQVQENPALDIYSVGTGINLLIGVHHIIRLDTGLLFEELNPDESGRQWLLNLGYRYRF